MSISTEYLVGTGQIYRDVERCSPERACIHGKDYVHGLGLTGKLAITIINYIKGAQIWMVKADGLVAWSNRGTGQLAKAKKIIVATGALERSLPVPGWTKPGVMTFGAAQILLK